jgi:hypothetical protein
VRDEGACRAPGRCARIFVDEFQDTDPLQAELLLLLAADDPAERDWSAVRPVAGRKLSSSADPKQSNNRIRRSRRAGLSPDVPPAGPPRGAPPGAEHQLPHTPARNA